MLAAVFSLSCTQLQRPEPEPFFAETVPPPIQEFRWSNGKLPKSFDPALASAPPETDIVRALYEGLTETDPATLQETAAAAESWTSSEDSKIWIFKIRKNAKWSNGKPVTAHDFVRSWTRLIRLGDKAAHANLLLNIAGVPRKAPGRAGDPAEELLRSIQNDNILSPPMQQLSRPPANDNSRPGTGTAASNTNMATPPATPAPGPPAGIVAEDDLTLKVTLAIADKEFPRLVANPIFRPVFDTGDELSGKDLNPAIVTNGPFTLSGVDPTGIVLVRSTTYWDRENVSLERVHMVAMESSEKALAAYRSGELDAITNADFSPLVLKLLSPYEDFRKTTHSALNFYEVNSSKAPFSDRRVREALSNAIERDRLSEGEMEGQTRPALGFLPYSTTTRAKLTQDKEKARALLDEAGFPDGEGFPVIRLLVNRNDTQQRIARSVAKMFKQNLNVETEIIVKDQAELERSREAGDFDLVRRGVVFPTSNQTANFMAIFEHKPWPYAETSPTPALIQPVESPLLGGPSAKSEGIEPFLNEKRAAEALEPVILTEEDALYELRAIPLYFPTSYSLVKPYVSGFEMNSLDAITLTGVAIDNSWRPSGNGAKSFAE